MSTAFYLAALTVLAVVGSAWLLILAREIRDLLKPAPAAIKEKQ